MKGDFSRIRFNPTRHYTSVLDLQGRPSVDADANEQCFINNYISDTENRDIVGISGAPRASAGFAVKTDGTALWFTPGRYYVDGLLVENEHLVYYDHQSFLLNPDPDVQELLTEARRGISVQVYLEVWQRLVTALDDLCLREPALGLVDTTARLQTVWRVVARNSTGKENGNCCDMSFPLPVFPAGRLAAQTGDATGDCSCQPMPSAGYFGLENQLYRIEIHTSGDQSSARFKWSRENASVVSAITGVSGNTVSLDSLGPDANLGFSSGQWVEISDDTDLFGQTPGSGTFYQIDKVIAEQNALSMTQSVPPVDLSKNPRLRRWDQFGASADATGVALDAGSWLALENGIQIQFREGNYQVGDYWTIPARTASGKIDWPPCGSDGALFQPPLHSPIYRVPLACISWSRPKEKWVVQDCRHLFDPLTDLTPPPVPSALHVRQISWRNDDVMTLDQLVYSTSPGTVSVTINSPAVVGKGTSFTTSLIAGQYVAFSSDNTARLYKIASITDDTHLTLASNFLGQSSSSASVLSRGLTLALDQPAPLSPYVSAANFTVILEVAIPLPLRAGADTLRAVATLPDAFKNTLLPVFRSDTVAVSAAATAAATPATTPTTTPAAPTTHPLSGASVIGTAFSSRAGSLLSAASGNLASTFLEEIPAVERFELILDGRAFANDSVISWIPFPSLNYDYAALLLIDELLAIGAARGIPSRVRVKVPGRALFSTDANGNQIYLDGQSFGTPATRADGVTARIDLQLPSGDGARASDFESWFYLAPIPALASFTVQPAAVLFNPSVPSPTAPQATVTLNSPAATETLVALSVANPPGAPPSVSLPASVTIPAGSISQTVNVSVSDPQIRGPYAYTLTASLPPVLGITRSLAATLTLTGSGQ